MTIAYLLLGTNIGCRADHLKKATALIGQRAGTIHMSSSIYETAAWGKIKQEDYLNQVLQLETALSPEQLLETTADIENQMGRIRKSKWGPRIIDIDILFYGDTVRSDDKLTLPHPFIAKRRFVLTPLAEIAPNLVHPVLQKRVEKLLSQCTDPLWVERYEAVAIP